MFVIVNGRASGSVDAHALLAEVTDHVHAAGARADGLVTHDDDELRTALSQAGDRRVVLVGGDQLRFNRGDRLKAELRINAGEGHLTPVRYLAATCELDNQRNVAFDFKPPDDVAQMSDVRVTVSGAYPVGGAMLYSRGRLLHEKARIEPSPDLRPQVMPRRLEPSIATEAISREERTATAETSRPRKRLSGE